MFSPKREQCRGVDAASADRYRISCRVLSLRRIRYLSMAARDQNTDRFIRKRVRAKGTRPTADIPVADRDQARRRVYSATAFPVGEIYLPSLRDSDASTLRTSDWEIPNCLAMREGVIPALKAARTALTWPRVNATLGSSGCRRSGDSSVVVD